MFKATGFSMVRTFLVMTAMTCLWALSPTSSAEDKPAADGWTSLFDGTTLNGWDGDPSLWRVEAGTITGQTKDNSLKKNSFLIWRGGEIDNFELELEYRIVGGNSGIQYRSFELPDGKWRIGGYQADFEAGDRYSGILYGEAFRGILADRGESTELVRAGDKFEKKVTGSVGDSNEIQTKIRKEDWNQYRVVADGYHFQHFINGAKTIDCIDSDEAQRRAVGLLALQIHVGPPMTVQFRNIRLKKLPAPKKVALIAGKPSHGYGAHEHRAGCMILAEALNSAGIGVQATVYTNGWPEDEKVLDHCDSIVIYSDGGNGHPFNSHLDRLKAIQARGVGMVCIHYGVEVPKGDPGQAFLQWTGGYFETDWSVNPHWTASFKKFPEHPVARGVRPFHINDEWYYHMRFDEPMDRVTSILSDLPPSDTLVKADGTLSRPDGPHSNNEFVRTAVLKEKQPQTVAWAKQRSDVGRGFGFTGGHVHWNWGNRDFRTLILNAIAWSAHVTVPDGGVPSRTLNLADLQANQDYEVPPDFNPARIQSLLDEWNSVR
ncbi:MAG: family 16 glycoside hydrolase [Planctomyces sp.]|jgi:type 1 glutamine amidotransferase